MPSDSRSKAKATVIALSTVFDQEYVPIERYGFVGFEFKVSEPAELDTFTMRAAGGSRSSDSLA